MSNRILRLIGYNNDNRVENHIPSKINGKVSKTTRIYPEYIAPTENSTECGEEDRTIGVYETYRIYLEEQKRIYLSRNLANI